MQTHRQNRCQSPVFLTQSLSPSPSSSAWASAPHPLLSLSPISPASLAELLGPRTLTFSRASLFLSAFVHSDTTLPDQDLTLSHFFFSTASRLHPRLSNPLVGAPVLEPEPQPEPYLYNTNVSALSNHFTFAIRHSFSANFRLVTLAWPGPTIPS